MCAASLWPDTDVHGHGPPVTNKTTATNTHMQTSTTNDTHPPPPPAWSRSRSRAQSNGYARTHTRPSQHGSLRPCDSHGDEEEEEEEDHGAHTTIDGDESWVDTCTSSRHRPAPQIPFLTSVLESEATTPTFPTSAVLKQTAMVLREQPWVWDRLVSMSSVMSSAGVPRGSFATELGVLLLGDGTATLVPSWSHQRTAIRAVHHYLVRTTGATPDRAARLATDLVQGLAGKNGPVLDAIRRSVVSGTEVFVVRVVIRHMQNVLVSQKEARLWFPVTHANGFLASARGGILMEPSLPRVLPEVHAAIADLCTMLRVSLMASDMGDTISPRWPTWHCAPSTLPC